MDSGTAECRLCLSQKELVLVFNCDDEGPKKMNELILLTTGVEILEKDVISRKICTNCSKVVIKMHEFREKSIKTDKYLKEKCIEHLRATEMKIPNTNVTITTTKQLRKEKLDDSNHNISQTELSDLDGSKKDEKYSFSYNSNIPKKVKVHGSVSELFTRHPNLKLRTDVLPFDVNPFISLELDAVEKYCSDNNINFKLAAGRANSNCSSSISENQSFNPNNLENDQAQFKVTPVSTKHVDDTKFKIISNDPSKRRREDSESNETITATQHSKIKRRRLSSNDFVSDTDQSGPTLFETLELKPSQPSSKQIKTHKCNICLSVHKSAKALKVHYQEHFRCSFCKARFRIVERRISHEKKCAVGHALNSKPYVELTKVDLDLNVMNKYRLHNYNAGINTNSMHCNGVIELSDDDEPVMKSTNITNVRVVGTESSSIEKVTNEYETTHSSAKYNTFSHSPATISHNELLPQTEVSNIPNADEPSVQYSSTAIVKPDIKLPGNTLLNTNNLNGSDIVLLKELLQHAKRVKSRSLKQPTSEDITRNGTMKNMFLQLGLYKVPVNIRQGQHCVTISRAESEINREVTMWNDIKTLHLFNKKANLDINNITVKQNETVRTNSPATNNNPATNPATLQSVSVPVVLNAAVSKIHQTIENRLTPNTQRSKTHCSSQDQTKVPSSNIPPQSSTAVTFPNGARTVLSPLLTPNFLNTSKAHFLNSRNNTSPHNTNPSPPQILPYTSNNAIVNNARNNYQQEFIPSITSINSTNGISQVFRPPGDVVMTGNHRSILRPNNTSPLNRNASSPQIVPHIPNNLIGNNATHNSRQEFIPLSSPSPNSISPVFRSSDVIMTGSNHPSILRPNNTPPLNGNASLPQITSHALNNAIFNNTTNDYRPEFIDVSVAPIHSPNSISQDFRSSGGSVVIDSNHRSILRSVTNPGVTDYNLTNYNHLSAGPNQRNVQFAYLNSNQQITAPSPNNQRVILNSLVANADTTQYNNLQHNALNTISLTTNNDPNNFSTSSIPTYTPNDNTNNFSTSSIPSYTPKDHTNNFSTSSIPCQTSILPNNFTFSRPMIRVKSLHELR
ncbi:putative uncharacterized protein DDB_G0277255 isoform X5 [Diabrotica virgifera virgifera]|uniref:ZAD domain-containing protein n=1 Tax=Diabrotica virgifera virgifera TaxID=50390 RepID=A0ABM5KVU6_DIAVI|nr:putative uncharacterized protein DDB_G0277255 isoform X5 [Diabrotica virgifera virgifera]